MASGLQARWRDADRVSAEDAARRPLRVVQRRRLGGRSGASSSGAIAIRPIARSSPSAPRRWRSAASRACWRRSSACSRAWGRVRPRSSASSTPRRDGARAAAAGPSLDPRRRHRGARARPAGDARRADGIARARFLGARSRPTRRHPRRRSRRSRARACALDVREAYGGEAAGAARRSATSSRGRRAAAAASG